MSCEVDIDIEKRELTFVVANEDDEIVYAIYDGYELDYYDYGEYGGSGYEKKDISDKIDALFDAIEEAEDFDLEEFLEDYVNDDIDDIVNIKALEKSLKAMYRNLNSNSWLKKNAGFSKEKVNGATVYTFNPDLYNLATATLDEFEDCFEDDDDYEYLTDMLKDNRSDMRDIDITVSIGVKSGKLSSFEVGYEEDDGDFRSMELKFSNVGSTKIGTDTLEDILDSATEDSYSSYYDYYY